MTGKNGVTAGGAEDMLLIVLCAEADDIHDEQGGLGPQHGDIHEAVEQNTGNDGDGEGIALMALVLPVQADDLADIDDKIPEQDQCAGDAEIHEQLQQQVVGMTGIIAAVEIMDTHIGIVAAAEQGRIQDAFQCAGPDAQPFAEILCEGIHAGNEGNGIAEEQNGQNAESQNGKIGGEPFFSAAFGQQDGADDEQNHIGGTAFGEFQRQKIHGDQQCISDAHGPVLAFQNIIETEKDDQRYVKRIVIGVEEYGAVAGAVGPAQTERLLDQRDEEAVGAHEADKGEDETEHTLGHRVGDEDHGHENKNHENTQKQVDNGTFPVNGGHHGKHPERGKEEKVLPAAGENKALFCLENINRKQKKRGDLHIDREKNGGGQHQKHRFIRRELPQLLQKSLTGLQVGSPPEKSLYRIAWENEHRMKKLCTAEDPICVPHCSAVDRNMQAFVEKIKNKDRRSCRKAEEKVWYGKRARFTTGAERGIIT